MSVQRMARRAVHGGLLRDQRSAGRRRVPAVKGEAAADGDRQLSVCLPGIHDLCFRGNAASIGIEGDRDGRRQLVPMGVQRVIRRLRHLRGTGHRAAAALSVVPAEEFIAGTGGRGQGPVGLTAGDLFAGGAHGAAVSVESDGGGHRIVRQQI